MRKKTAKRKNEGFTLVELIVVLVILAILAAILVPALLGYIDRARTKQDMLDAKSCMTAVQAQMAEMYATRPQIDTSLTGAQIRANYCAINGYFASNSGSGKNTGDIDVYKTDYAKPVFQTAGCDPITFIVGMGDFSVYAKTEIHKCYTVYLAAYWSKWQNKPIFFDGTKWTTTYPWKGDGQNTFNGVSLEMYIYAIGNSKGNSWSNSDQMWKKLKEAANRK